MAKKRVLIFIDEDLEKEFRQVVSEVFGYHRGALSKAYEEAMRLWIKVRRHCISDNSVCGLYGTDECPLSKLFNNEE